MNNTRSLPAGTVTFLFTDVEGSTKLLHELGAADYAAALAEHRRMLREAFVRHGGVEVDTQGDAFFVAFPTAPGALAAAREAQEALTAGPIRVRIGLHTGTPFVGEEGYIGPDVHRAARIAAAGHGGQVLVSAATAALVDSAELHDLGAHRLKDLSAPERIYQLEDGEFPPLKTLHQTNLPVPATPFLGREAELAEVSTLLARDGVRLVTLTGPGGTGKTRLALAVAGGAAERYPDGVWWVPLAPLRDPALVLESAATALGASGDLAEHVADKRLLLLLDNFEHLTPAADDLAPLLARCPNLSLLVTSREPLHISGEHEYAVDPLRRSEAVELFMTRALAARRDVVANGEVAQICERLDHLPLAIELAAARVKVLSPKALLERLERRLPVLAGGARDLPERQRTLRATIEWSHELLTSDEQRLFARLSVFRGGCTLEAAEAVADADLDTLQSLVDKSLLRVRDERFWMLETIREYAAERLDAFGDGDEIRDRHTAHFIELAKEAEPHVRADSAEWADRLGHDHDNLRAALDWLEATGQAERLLDLAGKLWRFWYLKSHLTEGRRRLEGTLATDGPPTAERAKAMSGAAVMTLNLGDPSAARRWAERSLDAHRAIGDEWGVAYATMMIGNAIGEDSDIQGARPFLEDAARRFAELGDRHYALITNLNLGWVMEELGDIQEAEALHRENLAVARELANERMVAGELGQLAMIARDRGELDNAASQLRESIRIDHRLGTALDLAIDLARLASVLVRAGDGTTAARLLASSTAQTAQLGAKDPWWVERRNTETLSLLRSALDPGVLERELEAGTRLSVDEAAALALGGPEPGQP